MFWTCKILLFCVLLNPSHQQIPSVSNTQWNYAQLGPDTWHRVSAICNGDHQSPVDIDTAHVVYDSHLSSLSLNGYLSNNSIYVWNVTHDGNTIVGYPPPLAQLSISGAHLPEIFYLVYFQLHWGYNAFQGSEHTIDGHKYPLELQFVHQAPVSRSIAILSVLFNAQDADNPYLSEFLSVLNRTTTQSASVQQQIDLAPLFPIHPTKRFYRYEGSLTSPPCTEGVTWIVLAGTVPISPRQLELFTHNSVQANFRATEKLHERKIYASFHTETHGSTGEDTHDHEHGGGHQSSAVSCYVQQTFLFFVLSLFSFLMFK